MQIRKAMVEMPSLMTGISEIDETYIGGKGRGRKSGEKLKRGRAITKRGLQKALGIPSSKTGTILENFLLSYKNYDNKLQNFNVIESGFTNVARFTRKGAGGFQPDSMAFEATFLMEVCHFIQDLKQYWSLPFEWDYIHKNATIIERAAEGILLLKLDEKNPVKETGKRKWTFDQFLNDIGKKTLKEHITRFITIAEISNDKRQFDSLFAKAFKLKRQPSSFEDNYDG